MFFMVITKLTKFFFTSPDRRGAFLPLENRIEGQYAILEGLGGKPVTDYPLLRPVQLLCFQKAIGNYRFL